MTGIDRKVFLRALSWLWDHGNRQRNGGDMTEWSLWQFWTFSWYLFGYLLLLLHFLELLFTCYSVMSLPLWAIWAMPLLPNSTMISFVLFCTLNIGSFSFPALLFSLLLYLSFYILYTALSSFLFSLPLSLSNSMLLGRVYTIYYLFVLEEGTFVYSSCRFRSPNFYILHTLYMLPPSPLWSILSQVKASLLVAYSLSYSILVPFPM